MHLDGVDPETMRLIIQTQLDDLQEIARRNDPKGKGRQGGAEANLNVVLETYRAELAATEQLLTDQAMCKSMSLAAIRDGDAIRAAMAVNEQIERDHRLAMELSGRPMPRASGIRLRDPNLAPSHRALDDTTMERLKSLYVCGEDLDDEPSQQAESSAWAASRPTKRQRTVPTRACLACTEQIPAGEIVACPCSHEYCRGCLRDHFTLALRDETLFPPRCCNQAIPIDSARALLSAASIGQFMAKKIEFDTPNRTYCHRPTCSIFIPPQFIVGDVATCLQCRASTCTICKGASHLGADCPNDPSTQALLELAEQEGWQRCTTCRRFVELNTGCNHITCRCGAEFCYTCGARWQTCTCALWNEDRLVDRAQAIVNRNAEVVNLPQAQREGLVERERRHLVANHECEHRQWRGRSGSYQCETCNDTLPNFIYECRQCRIMACRRCRYNRL